MGPIEEEACVGVVAQLAQSMRHRDLVDLRALEILEMMVLYLILAILHLILAILHLILAILHLILAILHLILAVLYLILAAMHRDHVSVSVGCGGGGLGAGALAHGGGEGVECGARRRPQLRRGEPERGLCSGRAARGNV